jgi:acetate kinase
MQRFILTVNGGSSSIKATLFDISAGHPVKTAAASLTRIGLPAEEFAWTDLARNTVDTGHPPQMDLITAANYLGEQLLSRFSQESLVAVGHRIVHGGGKYWGPERIDADLLQGLSALIPFDPLHMPSGIELIRVFSAAMPVPQYACFDTSFCHSLPAAAATLPLPQRFASGAFRRLGFHGLSYSHIMHWLNEHRPALASTGRIVLAHLGSGSSLTAVSNGEPVDTSMAFTPNSGIPMGTRCGDLDAGLIRCLCSTYALSIDALDTLLTQEAGLLGISGISSDMKDLLNRSKTSPSANLAIDVYCYQIKKVIGAYSAAMGGLDGIVFTGGIGEKSPDVRARICSGLEFLSVYIDPERNASNAQQISRQNVGVPVLCIQADEELTMARMVANALNI